MKILLKIIKSFAVVFILQIIFLIHSGFIYNKGNIADTKPQYYFVVAYENGYNKPGQPVVSNVVYAINKDGYLDLVNTGHEHEGANSIILWGNHTGKYSTERMVILPKVNGNGAAIDIDFIDYDKNGQTDIVLTRTGDNTGSLAFSKGYYIQIS